nr:nuclear transport factor 2 family protein [Rhodococcus sp. HNM0569]
MRAALKHYGGVVDECSRTRDWRPFADLFTPDVEYIEHAFGTFHGREAVREWIVDVMSPYPHMRLRHDWVAVDVDNDAVVAQICNILDHPDEPGVEFTFPNVSRLVYAGDLQFSSQEDVYNPARDAPQVVGEWIAAGGRLAARPNVRMKYPAG